MGQFAKKAEEVLGDWESRLAGQEAKLHEVIPSSKAEATIEALKRLREMRQQANSAGYTLRSHFNNSSLQSLLANVTPKDHVPGREVMIDLPAVKEGSWYDPRLASKEAGILGALLDPIRNGAEELRLDVQHGAKQKLNELTATTSDPKTLPWYYPAAALTVPSAFSEGYQRADDDVDTRMHADLDKRVAILKKQFEEALKSEYHEAKGTKVASAGELIDGLAKSHVKQAEGEMNQATGLYLALAALLGQGAYHVGRSWTEKNDPRRQKLKAVEDMVKQRARGRPMSVLVSPEALPESDEPYMSLGEDATPKLAALAPGQSDDEGVSGEMLAGAGLAGVGAAGLGFGMAGREAYNKTAPLATAAEFARMAEKNPQHAKTLTRMIPAEYILGAHEGIKRKILGIPVGNYMNVYNKILNKLKLGDFKDKGHFDFVQRHYSEFGKSPRNALEMSINEAYDFNKTKTPSRVPHLMADYDKAVPEMGEAKALRRVLADPKYEGIAQRIGVNKAPWARLYSGLRTAGGALPFIGGAGLATGAGLMAHSALKKKKPKDADTKK